MRRAGEQEDEKWTAAAKAAATAEAAAARRDSLIVKTNRQTLAAWEPCDLTALALVLALALN